MSTTTKICKDCENFLGGGDWNLCCSNPPEETWCGYLCYENTPACINFIDKKIKPNKEDKNVS